MLKSVPGLPVTIPSQEALRRPGQENCRRLSNHIRTQPIQGEHQDRRTQDRRTQDRCTRTGVHKIGVHGPVYTGPVYTNIGVHEHHARFPCHVRTHTSWEPCGSIMQPHGSCWSCLKAQLTRHRSHDSGPAVFSGTTRGRLSGALATTTGGCLMTRHVVHHDVQGNGMHA